MYLQALCYYEGPVHVPALLWNSIHPGSRSLINHTYEPAHFNDAWLHLAEWKLFFTFQVLHGYYKNTRSWWRHGLGWLFIWMWVRPSLPSSPGCTGDSIAPLSDETSPKTGSPLSASSWSSDSKTPADTQPSGALMISNKQLFLMEHQTGNNGHYSMHREHCRIQQQEAKIKKCYKTHMRILIYLSKYSLHWEKASMFLVKPKSSSLSSGPPCVSRRRSYPNLHITICVVSWH